MRHGNATGFLRVIVEVTLCVHIGAVADDLDGALVCTDGTVRTEAPEFATDGSFRFGFDKFVDIQG